MKNRDPGDGEAVHGLTTSEARERLGRFGPNRLPEERRHPLLALLTKFWAPVPWMLEATIVLQLLLGKLDQALIIAGLLVFNSVLSFLQENQANRALALLRSRLSVRARVRRDGQWQLIPAEELVPGDAIHLRVGDLAPADMRVLDGVVLADESDLTGESLPVEREAGTTVYAGAKVKRGEATGEVTATGQRTYFGKTAELVKTAKTASHLQEIIFAIVRYLVILDAALVGSLLVYAAIMRLAWADILPFALMLLVASVPVALPATFTVATVMGALDLSKRGVFVTRLSAIEEAAAMDVLCTDKTGTLTQNRLMLAQLVPTDGRKAGELLQLAALASDQATQDPLDLAILEAAQAQKLLDDLPHRSRFIPFDPATKRSEAFYPQDGGILHVVKGAPDAVRQLVPDAVAIAPDVERLAARGARVLAVATGTENSLQFAGLISLEDRLREDSKAMVQNLQRLGVRVIMVTGDGAATAGAVAAEVSIPGRVCMADGLHGGATSTEKDCNVFAGVFPEDKFRLVEMLQRHGHVVGMTGDGVNDAPALKQAEAGIAVSTAIDVAKAAASVVLTKGGLTGVVDAVENGRRIYQRMLTYTLNKIIKTLEIAVLLSLGLILTGTFLMTPLLVVFLLFTNDFVTMAIATDRVTFSPQPDRWHIRTLMLTAGSLAALILMFSVSAVFVARALLQLPLNQLQTFVFVMLVLTGQGTVYLVRERNRLWHSRPSLWLLASSMADVTAVSLMATKGILMAAIPVHIILGLLLGVILFLLFLDSLKVSVFRHFGVR